MKGGKNEGGVEYQLDIKKSVKTKNWGGKGVKKKKKKRPFGLRRQHRTRNVAGNAVQRAREPKESLLVHGGR